MQLKSLGYRAIHLPTHGYHLRPLESHAAALRKQLDRLAEGAEFDVVSFSFGGMLLRAAVHPAGPKPRRVVMLSPPNRGAMLAEQVRSQVPVHRLGWDPLAMLLPQVLGFPLPEGEVGILTGGTGGDVGYNRALPGDNDGKVRVEEARMEGAHAFKVIPQRHFQMPFSARAIQETRCFLETGAFL